MNWLAKIIDRFALRPPAPEVVLHDPHAAEPHDLDDPFLDEKAQERMGAAISDAKRRK
ncbi:MAG: hypothetical protein WCG92_10040 [Hyphomicrobiales bacterium]|nr:hypothetical protein [Alphaproteobacteria bacterium]